MATTGYVLAGNVAQVVTTNLTYANLTNALAENDSVASGTTATKNATATLEFTNFGFDALVPSGATITQVNLKIRGSATTGASVQATALRITTTDGTELSIGTFNAALQTAESLAYARPGGGSWDRTDLLNGTLKARARSLQPNNTTSRTYAWAWVEVEVVYETAATLERAADVDASINIASAGEFFSEIERAASVDASIDITTAGLIPERITHAVATTNTTDGSTFTSDAFTPAANDLLVVISANSGINGADTWAVTDSQGGTYTENRSTVNSNLRMYVANQLVPAATSTTVTFARTAGSTNVTANILMVARVSGVSRTGASAVKQFDGSQSFIAAGTPGVTFGSAVQTANPTILALRNQGIPAAVTPPTDWVEHADTGVGTPNTGSEYVSRKNGFTGTTVSWGSTSATAGFTTGLEIDISSAGPTVFERSAAVDASVDIASAGEFFSIAERTSAVDLSPVIATAGQRDLLRAVGVDASVDIATAGNKVTPLERSVAVDLSPQIATSAIRELLRSVGVDASPVIASSGEIGGAVQRSAGVDASVGISTTGQVIPAVTRSAGIDLSIGISTAGQGFSILERTAVVDLSVLIASSGIFFGEDVGEPVKGPTRTAALAGSANDSAPIGTGSNSLEEV